MSEQNYWTRTAGRRLSRRGMLRGTAVAGLGLAGAALIGCGDDDEEEEAAPASVAAAASLWRHPQDPLRPEPGVPAHRPAPGSVDVGIHLGDTQPAGQDERE